MSIAKDQASTLLGTALLDTIREAVREEIRAAGNGHSTTELLTPEELAAKLKVPVSWCYEQSRQGKIPTHRIGRYIRFDLQEVIASQKKS
jgi:excisionase family DNA binding protein